MQSFATRWFGLRRDLGATYSPLFFLAALGNGGMAVTFFIWLNFLVPHPKTPIVTFDSIAALLSGANALTAGMIYLAMTGILIFAARYTRLLIWNLREFSAFRKTPAYASLRDTNAATTMMGLPLMLAMGVNVIFVVGAVFVPGLWNVVEYLFPLALLAQLAIGVLGMRIFLDIFGRALASGHFDCTRNNHLSQLQAPFAFVMTAVGLAAPAAMSTIKLTITLSIISSLFFLVAAALFGSILLVLGFRSMMHQGLAVEAGPSLWMLIPILTLAGITLIRISHGLHYGFEAHIAPWVTFMLTATIVATQLVIGLIGYNILSRVGYFRTYVWGEARSPGSYGLICPAVAMAVFGLFFINPGLVQNGVIVKYSLVHYLSMLPIALLQLAGIVTMLRLDQKLIRPRVTQPAAEAAAA